MRLLRVPIGLACAAVGACGGGGPTLDPDAGPVDAAPPPDMGPHVCATPGDFGAATLTDEVAAGGRKDGGEPYAIVYNGRLDADPDELQIELVSGFGAFLDGIATGDFTIEGDDLQYESCGLCVRVFTEDEDQQYLATGGSVSITSIDPDVTGTVSNLTFVEVTLSDTFVSTPVPDGCATAIASGAFTATVVY